MNGSIISDEGQIVHDGDRRWEAIAQPAPPSGWHSGKLGDRDTAMKAAAGHGPGKYVICTFTAHVDGNSARWLQNEGGFVITVHPNGKNDPVDARGRR